MRNKFMSWARSTFHPEGVGVGSTHGGGGTQAQPLLCCARPVCPCCVLCLPPDCCSSSSRSWGKAATSPSRWAGGAWPRWGVGGDRAGGGEGCIGQAQQTAMTPCDVVVCASVLRHALHCTRPAVCTEGSVCSCHWPRCRAAQCVSAPALQVAVAGHVAARTEPPRPPCPSRTPPPHTHDPRPTLQVGRAGARHGL